MKATKIKIPPRYVFWKLACVSMEMRDCVELGVTTHVKINSQKDIFEDTGNHEKDVKHSKQSFKELEIMLARKKMVYDQDIPFGVHFSSSAG